METFLQSLLRSSRTSLRSSKRHTFVDVPTRGFTLAEIIVVITIIGFVSSVVIARYRDFDSSAILKNLAYEVALSVREAQVMTVSASNLGGGGVLQNQGQNSYGVHFTADANTYVLFNDFGDTATPPNNVYDGGEMVKLITLTQGAKILELHELRSGEATLYPITYATIAFDRPHLDTSFVTSSNSNNVTEIIATVSSPRGATRTVKILKSGRIEAD